MFLGHVSTSVLAWFSFRNYGFSDGADLFVFISGYTSALVFGRRMLEGGFIFGTARLLRRVWQIYAAHILLFVFYPASIHFFSNRFNAPGLVDRFNVAHPVERAVNPNDKTNLAPYRFLHLVIAIILGTRFIPIDAAGLQAAVWKPLIKCGQQSLEVLAVGIYLSFIGYFILTTTSDGIIAQLLVGTAGIAAMTAVAYYRSWSKRVEKTAHTQVGPPLLDKSHATVGELARPAERAVVGVA